MWTFLLPLLLHAVENAPMLLSEVEKIFAELGAKDGGVDQLAKAAAVFAALADRASNASQGGTLRDGTPEASQKTPNPPNVPLDAIGNPILNAADQAALDQKSQD